MRTVTTQAHASFAIGAAAALLIGLTTSGLPVPGADARPVEPTPTPGVATEVLHAFPTPGPATPQPVLLSLSVSRLLADHLAVEAGPPGRRAPWHGRVTSVDVGLQTAVVRTNLADTPEDRQIAEAIADAVDRFAWSSFGRDLSRLDVQVLGSGDARLVERASNGLALRSKLR